MAKPVKKGKPNRNQKTVKNQKQKSNNRKQDYDNNMRGVLFKNRRKKTDKHPDYTGQIEIEGNEYWLSAWVNKSRQGQQFLSLTVQPKDEQVPDNDYDDSQDDDGDDFPF